MRLLLCLLVVACAWASEDESRAKKHPFVVDAVGNTLPPPSNVPATVGSPVNLLTPDRYEFYTFDESGELVKRLMTLEEIQAIVAAGEEAEGLVTFANDNQPTMAFNFSQPPHNKVHSVVTNVQNVLKAQMEAHKNNPVIQPTLDTPDVSDSWSLILPSIFGNTGLDIVPDKVANSVTPPETDTLDFNDINLEMNPDFTSKEGNTDVSNNSTTNEINESLKSVSTTTEIVENIKNSSTTTTKTIPTTTTTVAPSTTRTTTTTTSRPTSTTTTSRPTSTTTKKPTTSRKPTTTTKRATTIKTTTTTLKPIRRTTTTVKPSTVKATTVWQPVTKLTTKKTAKPVSTTESTVKITTTQAALSTTNLPLVTNVSSSFTILRTTTTRPKIVNTINSNVTSTTPKLDTTTSSKTTEKLTTRITTSKPFTTKNQPVIDSTTLKVPESNINKDEIFDTVSATDKNTVQYEKIDTFVPVSSATFVTEKTIRNTVKEILASTTSINLTTTTEKTNTVTQKSHPTITTYKPTIEESNYVSSTAHNQDSNKFNTTTITTQSVSPSTTVSSTEFIKLENLPNGNISGIKPAAEMHASDNIEPEMHIFDVVQSFSQIASDLGSSYMPIPTVSNVVDSTKQNNMDLESKENFELDILTDLESKKSNISDNSNKDNFIKISTIDPHSQSDEKENTNKDTNTRQPDATEKYAAAIFESTTIDRVLSESMGDLLSQVVNQAPLLESDNNFGLESKTTTEKYIDSTTTEIFSDVITTTSETVHMNLESDKSDNDISSPEKTSINATYPTAISTEVPLVVNKIISTNGKTQNDGGNETYVQTLNLNDKNNSSELKLSENKLINDTKDTNNEKSTESTIEEISKTTTNVIQTFETSTTIKPIVSEMIHAATPIESSTADSMGTNKINKIPDYVPKIDEFKKKIQKVNIDDKELANERNNSWKLISTVSPPKSNEITKDKIKTNVKIPGDTNLKDKDIILDFSKENQGLEVTTKDLEEDVAKFTELCNELAFRYWNTITENIDKRRSFVLSPYSITSMLAMMFMGARGATSGEMNDILKLDDMVTFNPHFTLKNISDSIETTPDSGVIVSAFIRELYSDRNKGKILTFYKERAQQFYNGHVEEINFKLISDIIRRRTNLLVKRYTWGKIAEYMKANTITMQPPLAAFSANIFQTDCTGSSVEGRDGEMYFVVSPTVRQRRLVPVPAVVYRGGFLAGYDPVLDATAAALGNTNSIISTLFVMPGQQGNVVHGEDLEALEQRLLDTNPTTSAWNRLLRTLLPRIGLELQIPRFSHKSIFNISSTLRNMGLKDLFDADHADLGGLNGPSKDLYLSDMIQSTSFVTCGEGVIGEQHHVEDYPESLGTAARRRSSRWASDWDEPRDYQRAFHDPHDVGEAMHLPLHLRPRQARLPSRNAQPARLKFDRPFLYFVRHNPSGMILYVGRYNPRLLP